MKLMDCSLAPPNPVFQAVVEWYHARHCRSSHTDQCGWGYESRSDWKPTTMWSHISFTRRTLEWLAAPDAPNDVAIERWIRREYNSGHLTTADIQQVLP